MKDMKTDQSKTTSHLDVLILGAGFSGICAGIKLAKAGINNFAIYDKAQGIGGTWWINTYPGAACDVASHLYCYSFEPNPQWSRVYATQPEIQAYIESCARKYGLLDRIHLGQNVSGFKYDDAAQLWECHFEDGHVVRAVHVINGAGGLHQPAYPNVPGIDEFKGESMHSARWNHEVDFTGKRVVMIGGAASAIQIAPRIAKQVEHLTIIQRTPNHILPRRDREYTEKEKQQMQKWPLLSKLRRWFFFLRGELFLYPLARTKEHTKYQARAAGFVKQFIDAVVKKPEYREKLIPSYPVTCKRLLISDDFYVTLNRNNVALVSQGIDRITDKGVVSSDGVEHATDIIVYATGYDIDSHVLSIDVTGPQGRSLKDLWDDIPEAYEGVFISGMPNYYMVTGPNTGVGTTSVVFMIEQSVNYILKCIRKTGINMSIEVQDDAVITFNKVIQNDLQKTVWAGNCRSYYKREDGRISTLYPYNARTFRRRHKKPNFRHFIIRNRVSA